MTYWPPKDIIYTREQIEWLLPHLDGLRAGIYPDVVTSGYTDIPGGQIRPCASYTTVCNIAAEIDTRLQHCGLDRYLVEDHYAKGLEVENIAGMYYMPQEIIYRKIQSVISYISSGRCQRWQDCAVCLSKCKKEGRRPTTYQEWTGHRRNYRNAKM